MLSNILDDLPFLQGIHTPTPEEEAGMQKYNEERLQAVAKLKDRYNLYVLVRQMREAQNDYFKNRTGPESKRYLAKSKELEALVDKEIARHFK